MRETTNFFCPWTSERSSFWQGNFLSGNKGYKFLSFAKILACLCQGNFLQARQKNDVVGVLKIKFLWSGNVKFCVMGQTLNTLNQGKAFLGACHQAGYEDCLRYLHCIPTSRNPSIITATAAAVLHEQRIVPPRPTPPHPAPPRPVTDDEKRIRPIT